MNEKTERQSKETLEVDYILYDFGIFISIIHLIVDQIFNLWRDAKMSKIKGLTVFNYILYILERVPSLCFESSSRNSLAVLEKFLGSWSAVFVNTEQREDEIVKRIFELSLHGTPHSSPAEHVSLSPEEMLPVVSYVGEDSPKTPHISRGGDVRIISPQNLRCKIADCAPKLGGAVVHRGGGLT